MPASHHPAEDFGEILAAAWALLSHGATDSNDPLHWPVMATMGAIGPDARTVVLRAVHPADRGIDVYSDRRSGKLAELQRDPRTCMVFHHPQRRVQLRVWGPMRVLTQGDQVDQAWNALSPSSRALYRQVVHPGYPIARPQDAEVLSVPEAGREQFAVLRLSVHALDCLHLHDGHQRRCRFDWPENQDTPMTRWLAP